MTFSELIHKCMSDNKIDILSCEQFFEKFAQKMHYVQQALWILIFTLLLIKTPH